MDMSKPLLWPMTGPLMIIPLVLALGYTKIYLLGCDHDTLLSYSDRSPVKNFYAPEQDMRIKATSSDSWDNTNIMRELEANLMIHKQYAYYQQLVEDYYPGVEILNLSPTSWLDLFPRVRFESI